MTNVRRCSHERLTGIRLEISMLNLLKPLSIWTLIAWSSTVMSVPASALEVPGIDPAQSVESVLAGDDPVAIYGRIKTLRNAVWSAMPLGVARAIFVNAPAERYRAFDPRPNADFRQDDTLHVYLEPIGFGHQMSEDGAEIRLQVDIAIKNASGQRLINQANFAEVIERSTTPTYEFAANVSLAISSFPAGSYTLEITLRDAVGDKTTDTVLAFQVIGLDLD